MSLKNPRQIKTLGDHIRRCRLDQGLSQGQVAKRVGVSEATIYRWERNETSAQIHHMPKIIKFVGYDPEPQPNNVAEALLAARRAHGWTRRQAAKAFELYESTLARVELGKGRRLAQKTLRKLTGFLGMRPTT